MLKKVMMICLLMCMFVAPVRAAYVYEDGSVEDELYVNVHTDVVWTDYNSVHLELISRWNWGYYTIYRATSEDGKYHKVAETSKEEITINGLVTDKYYYFKIRAHNPYGYFETPSVMVKPKLNNITAMYNARGNISWDMVGGAHGYAVYRAKSGGTFKKIATTKSNRYPTKKGYYYKVRAYRKVNGKYCYSNYSTIVKGQ